MELKYVPVKNKFIFHGIETCARPTDENGVCPDCGGTLLALATEGEVDGNTDSQ
jgi:hypothetical protein